MSNKRVAARAVAVSSGALMLGVLSIGPAMASGGGGTDPLGGVGGTVGGVVSGTGNTVNKTVNKVTKHKKHKHKKSGTDPVDKVTKTVTKTVNGTTKTVTKVVNSVTGSGSNPGGGKSPVPVGSKSGSGSASHGQSTKSAGGTTTTRSGQARQGVRTGGAGTGPEVSAGFPASDFVGTDGMGRTGFAGVSAGAMAPRVASAPQLAPQVAGNKPKAGGPTYDLTHPAALGSSVSHDPTLQLELLVVASVLAGGVALGHVTVARRRLITKAGTTSGSAAPGKPSRLHAAAS